MSGLWLLAVLALVVLQLRRRKESSTRKSALAKAAHTAVGHLRAAAAVAQQGMDTPPHQA